MKNPSQSRGLTLGTTCDSIDWMLNTVLTRYLLNLKGKRLYLHNILFVLIDLFILRMFTFLMPPQENSLMELGNTFWLWGVLIVQRSVERSLDFHVSKKKSPKTFGNESQFRFRLFKKASSNSFVVFRFHTFDLKRKGVITSPRIEFVLSNLHFWCPHELNMVFIARGL